MYEPHVHIFVREFWCLVSTYLLLFIDVLELVQAKSNDYVNVIGLAE